MAVKAARERARDERGISEPEMVLPDQRPRRLPQGGALLRHRGPPGAGAATTGAPMSTAWPTASTATPCSSSVSAPQYPQGVIDPIPELAALAAEAGANFHTDACMGGYVLPFLEQLGEPIPPWDFRVEGVTTISADLHKLGYAPKGASVILHRSRRCAATRPSCSTTGSAGFYASPAMQGTRPALPMATAWATLHHLGMEGYLRLTELVLDARIRLVDGIRAIAGITVLGEPDAHLVAIAADAASPDPVDVFAVADALQVRGWFHDRQAPPDSLHLTISAGNAPVLDEYISDLAACVDEVRGQPRRRPFDELRDAGVGDDRLSRDLVLPGATSGQGRSRSTSHARSSSRSSRRVRRHHLHADRQAGEGPDGYRDRGFPVEVGRNGEGAAWFERLHRDPSISCGQPGGRRTNATSGLVAETTRSTASNMSAMLSVLAMRWRSIRAATPRSNRCLRRARARTRIAGVSSAAQAGQQFTQLGSWIRGHAADRPFVASGRCTPRRRRRAGALRRATNCLGVGHDELDHCGVHRGVSEIRTHDYAERPNVARPRSSFPPARRRGRLNGSRWSWPLVTSRYRAMSRTDARLGSRLPTSDCPDGRADLSESARSSSSSPAGRRTRPGCDRPASVAARRHDRARYRRRRAADAPPDDPPGVRSRFHGFARRAVQLGARSG